ETARPSVQLASSIVSSPFGVLFRYPAAVLLLHAARFMERLEGAIGHRLVRIAIAVAPASRLREIAEGCARARTQNIKELILTDACCNLVLGGILFGDWPGGDGDDRPTFAVDQRWRHARHELERYRRKVSAAEFPLPVQLDNLAVGLLHTDQVAVHLI